jgi:hypothetical protein
MKACYDREETIQFDPKPVTTYGFYVILGNDSFTIDGFKTREARKGYVQDIAEKLNELAPKAAAKLENAIDIIAACTLRVESGEDEDDTAFDCAWDILSEGADEEGDTINNGHDFFDRVFQNDNGLRSVAAEALAKDSKAA